ncbi:hypothetical protein LHJ74_12915 [Streptomyces sp. N2-109]|uniref:Secreted protein n=1 Tax=Streptomyces gossypii TaxID=2883101 RepID=A0ABT2JSD5_9ACTN|nr:hypothetical protein [Streptomyces gossypii]MCT2590802.1 hypothetical protein [Streptomyces gossypii]
MEALWASVVAVGGTLMGAVITHVFQRSASQRGELFARSEALRQERMTTYSSFAAVLEDYRHGQAGRWYSGQEDPDGAAYLAARDEAHRLRTVARQALYRVKLVTDDREVILAAERAYQCTRDISTAQERTERDPLDARARRAIEGFVARAAPLTR